MQSSAQFIDSSTAMTSDNFPRLGTKSANDADSDADTCCLGTNFAILECAAKQVDACVHDKSIKPLSNAPVVTGAAAWDDPVTNQTCILVVNEALHCGTKLDHSPIKSKALALIVGTIPLTNQEMS